MKSKKIWLAAGIVALIAALVVIVTTRSSDITADIAVQENYYEKTEQNDAGAASTIQSGETAAFEIKINAEDVGTKAEYYDVEIDATTVEVFAVRASDGTVRLAMNTCQVCNGSPFAYFEQNGDYFVCQNCGNQFSSDKIGIESGGCNPVPITADNYAEENGIITVSETFLTKNAYRFSNWKQF